MKFVNHSLGYVLNDVIINTIVKCVVKKKANFGR